MKAFRSGWRKAGLAAVITVTAASVWMVGGSGQAQVGSICFNASSHVDPGIPGNFLVDDPMEMNSVLVGKDVVKTVKVDKQVWTCDDDDDDQFFEVHRIVDIQIYVEIVEQVLARPPRGGGSQFPVLAKRFEVVICEKDPENLVDITCQVQKPAPEDSVPQLSGCNTGQEFGTRSPTHPIEMNTVVVGDVVKTIKAQKELFDCANADTGQFVVADLETFTEIFEKGPLLEPALKRVELAICLTAVDSTRGLAHPFVSHCSFLPEQVIFQ
jgi:hypothetical protein